MKTINTTKAAKKVAHSLQTVRAVPKPEIIKKEKKPLRTKSPMKQKTRIKVKPVSREYPEILAFAENVEKCQCCGEISDTIVAAHYSGMCSHELGKGMAVKGSDFFVGFICMRCHDDFDNPKKKSDVGQAFEFMFAILKSQRLLLKAGVIGVVDKSGEETC